eukprot:s1_g1015.t1
MSGSSKEWAIVLAIALFLHAAAGFFWWWSPAIELADPGAGSMTLSLAPSTNPDEDRSETESVDEEDSVFSEPEPIVEPEPPAPVVERPPVEIPPRRAEQSAPKPAVEARPSSAPAPHQIAPETRSVGQGQASAVVGVSNADAEADYTAMLASWLARHKRYPRAARRRNIEGVVTLSFTVNAVGTVTQYEIVDSSGYEMLDQEVAKMLSRAEPLPAIPKELGRSSFAVTIPVRFELSRF